MNKFIPLEPPLFNYEKEIKELKRDIIKALAIPPSILGEPSNDLIKQLPKNMLINLLKKDNDE